MTTLIYEMRQAGRALGRMPGTTALSVVTLAFGIAAATTTFSAIYAALLRPLPFADPDRLMFLHTTRQTASVGTVRLRWSAAMADALRERATALETVATYTRANVGITSEGGVAEQIDSEAVSRGYFEALQVGAALGRTFTAEEEAPGHAVVVLPQWNADEVSHVALCHLLSRLGIAALRLTLPYHEARRPAGFERAEYMVSPNVGRTLQSLRQAVIDTRAAVAWLDSQGYERIGAMGTSIGSCTAFLAFVHDQRIDAGVGPKTPVFIAQQQLEVGGVDRGTGVDRQPPAAVGHGVGAQQFAVTVDDGGGDLASLRQRQRTQRDSPRRKRRRQHQADGGERCAR